MSTGIIYFPYIQLPNNIWLYRSLLYWDKIGTIIPVGYREYLEENFSHGFLKNLFDRDLAVPVDPYETIVQGGYYDSFRESFLNYVNDEGYPAKNLNVNSGTETASIHVDKLGEELASSLSNLNLARLSEKGSPWWDVEKYTAGKFMAYLAGILGSLKDMTPSTDKRNFLSTFVNDMSSGGEFNCTLNPQRAIVLQGGASCSYSYEKHR